MGGRQADEPTAGERRFSVHMGRLCSIRDRLACVRHKKTILPELRSGRMSMSMHLKEQFVVWWLGTTLPTAKNSETST
jgi:hypothetical protein